MQAIRDSALMLDFNRLGTPPPLPPVRPKSSLDRIAFDPVRNPESLTLWVNYARLRFPIGEHDLDLQLAFKQKSRQQAYSLPPANYSTKTLTERIVT